MLGGRRRRTTWCHPVPCPARHAATPGEVLRGVELSEQIERQKQWVAERCDMVKAALIGRLEDAQAELWDGISARVGEWHGTGRETQHLRGQLQHTAELVAELHQGAFRTAGGGLRP